MALLKYIVVISFVMNSLKEAASAPMDKNIKGNYSSFGEYVIQYGGTKILQTAFEDDYDSINKISSLRLISTNDPTLILEYETEKKSWSFNAQGCNPYEQKTDPKFPNFKIFNINNGQGPAIFLPHQLITLKEGLKTANHVNSVKYRNVLAYEYELEFYSTDKNIPPMNIKSYWTRDREYKTTSKHLLVPLGLKITATDANNKATIHHINYLNFIEDSVDQEKFLLKLGTKCNGFDIYKNTKLPEFSGLKTQTLEFKTEFTFEGNVSYVDTWLDMEQKIVKMDYTPYFYAKEGTKVIAHRELISAVISSEQGTEYRIDETTGQKSVKLISDSYYSPELIMNYNDNKTWTVQDFFGTKSNTYTLIRPNTVGGIPCDVFQAERADWPPNEKPGSVRSIWEWCIPNIEKSKMKVAESTIPSFGLTIYVKSSYLKDDVEKRYALPGAILNYNFFNVKIHDSDYLTTTAFDISEHFRANDRMINCVFRVSPNLEDLNQLLTTETDYHFESAWRKAITAASELKLTSLRITGVKAVIIGDTGPMEVFFSMLNRHPAAGSTTREPTIEEVFPKLTKMVDNRKLSIRWPVPEKKELELVAQKNSLKLIENNFENIKTPSPEALHLRTLENIAVAGKVDYEGKPIVLQSMWAQEKAKTQGFSSGSLAWICGITLLVGIALGVVATRKARLGLRKRPVLEDPVPLPK